jgi:hypothetical protein
LTALSSLTLKKTAVAVFFLAHGVFFSTLCPILLIMSAARVYLILFSLWGLWPTLATAQAAAHAKLVYRCGNEYLNDQALALSRGCQPVVGGYISVVPGMPVQQASRNPNPALAAPGFSALNDARSILLAELKTARERLAEQEKLYNKGEPDKLGPETRNHQLYLDRLTELRAGIQRYSNDVAGLEREISRLPAQ